MNVALINGSFDPVTIGHVDVIARAAAEYDRVYVGMLINENKTYKYCTLERFEMLSAAVAEFKNVVPLYFSGTTLELCALLHINTLVRGVRTDADIEYDKKLMQGYDFEGAGVEVKFMRAEMQLKDISSTLVRNCTDEQTLKELVPDCVYELMRKYKSK